MPFPLFVRRWSSLRRARRELERGDVAGALGRLGLPELALSRPAEVLRGKALEHLVRRARAASAEGRRPSVRRHLETLAREAPQRARELEGELGLNSPGPEESRRSALRDLLGKLRRERGPQGADSSVHCLHLAVDDAGEVLLALGRELVIGHAGAGQADLGFMADLESRHARLTFSESFHGGPSWRLTPLVTGGEPALVTVDGEPLGGEGRELEAGALVVLGKNLAWTAEVPDPSSSALVLQLAAGAECAGAGRIVLAPTGDGGGRVSVGPGRGQHLAVDALEGAAHLVAGNADLCLLIRAGEGEFASPLRLTLPLDEAQRFRLGKRRGGGPPIELWLREMGWEGMK